MIAPSDAMAQMQSGSSIGRVPIPPVPTAPTTTSVVPNHAPAENRLSAPLAHFDDGFSSDQGAFLSGAETEREVTPTTDRDDSPDRTPIRDLPKRRARGAVQSPLSATETGEYTDDVGGGREEDEDGDIVKTAKITISPPKDVVADEARASLLLHQHDSLDMDADEFNSSSSPPPPPHPATVASVTSQAAPMVRNESMSGSNSPNAINQQLRQQYEIQAVSRPRATTPVSACAIESFVAVNPRSISDAEKMKISLPGSSFVAGSTVTAPVEAETQPEEPKHAAGGHKIHRRRSSMSWTEFQENMAASSYHTASGATSGRASGRTTPLSSSGVGDDEQDLLEQNPVYHDRVPPSPVVHRRASREWVGFEGENFGNSGPDTEFKPPPLSELVTEIQQTVNAWQRTDYEGATSSSQMGTAEEYTGYEQPNQGQEQYAPPPFDRNTGVVHAEYGDATWQQQQGHTNYYQQQEPPQEPFYDYSATANAYGSYAPASADQPYSYDATAGVSTYEYDTNYPPPPAPTSSYMDDWSSHMESTTNTAYTATGVVNTSAWETTTSMQYAQPAPAPSSVHDDWDNSPYAHLQLSYQQQQQQQQAPPPEPTEKNQPDLGNEKPPSATVPPARPAPGPPRPIPAAPEEKLPSEDKPGVSEEWLAFERMTQKMNKVVKQTQDSLHEMKKETVANVLPTTPYEVAIGHVAQSHSQYQQQQLQQQQKPPEKKSAAPTPVIDLLSSDFEPTPPAATVAAPEQAPTLQPSSSGDGSKEWKPIHEVLNDEIKKQKELQKPKRPPPPKAPPQRPPRPTPAAAATPSVPTSWDDTAPMVAPSHPPVASSAVYPSWDEANAAVPYNAHSSARVDTFSASAGAPEAPPVPYDSGTIIVPTQASLSNVTPIDYATRLGRSDFTTQGILPSTTSVTQAASASVPIAFDTTDLGFRDEQALLPEPLAAPTPAMDGSIPFTNSDIANQNHLQWNQPSEDDALFDVSKYSGLISGEAPASANQEIPAADDFDIFLKSDKPSSVSAPPAVPPPPMPPPRSPGPERMFIIEKDTPVPPRSHPTTTTTQANSTWADFDASGPSLMGNSGLPPSESDFYLKMTTASRSSGANAADPFAPQKNPYQPALDLLGSVENMEDSYDPFAVKSPEQIVAEAKAKAQAQLSAREAVEDLDFFGGGAEKSQKAEEEADEEDKGRESPGFGFRDDFAPPPGENEGAGGDDDEDVGPLYDEDDSQPLVEFPAKFTGEGWDMMLRFPVKKKMMAERCWKPVYVRLQGANIELYYGKNDRLPFQTLPLLANYCLSDVTTQQYDVYGKIHTVKLQYVIYKEKVGIRPGQIPKLVEGHFTKLGLPLEHAAQTSVLLKFGSLHHEEMQSLVYAVEDILFHIPAVRERPAIYKQDEIQVHCYDEYAAHVNKDGAVSDQRARVRLFCLAFVSGMPIAEIGLNDRRRQGKEVVRRKDIMPMYTERWIRFEALDFHSSVDKSSFDKEHVIRMPPLDACFFEVLRFRVRPPRGKELPLHVRSIMKIAGSKIEIRIEAMVAVFKSRKARQVPCEDIQIRFPIPEAWIYLFREERHWGYGSVHAKVRRPGKVKNIKDKIMGMVQNTETSLIEVAIGDAKYEHVYRSLVWRIPRLPEKHHGAYKTHLLRCRFELSSFDLMPETFIPNCEVEYTMPMATVSHTVVRSVSIEQHEDPDKVEKWVRYLAKYQYTVETDYVQTTDLDIEAIMDTTVLEPEKSLEKAPVKHQPSLDVGVAKDAHDGYRIDFSAAELGGGRYDKSEKEGDKKSSSDSSDEEDARDSRKPPLIQIDIKNYKY